MATKKWKGGLWMYTAKQPNALSGTGTPLSTAKKKTAVPTHENPKEESEETEKSSLDGIGALTDYRAAIRAAEAEYDARREALERERTAERRRAAVNRELLRKYLPVENERNGLASLGVSESARIEAENQYRRELSEAERGYREDANELEAERTDKLVSLRKVYGESAREDQDALYESTLEDLRRERFSSLEDLERILSTVKPHLRAEQLANLENIVAYYRNKPEYFE